MKTPEYRGIVPLCILVIVLALGASGFPADSDARSVLIGIASAVFVIGLAFFEMRRGWIRERHGSRGRRFHLILTATAAVVLIVVASAREVTRTIPVVGRLLGFLGFIAACALLEAVGSFAAMVVRNQKHSEPTAAANPNPAAAPKPDEKIEGTGSGAAEP